MVPPFSVLRPDRCAMRRKSGISLHGEHDKRAYRCRNACKDEDNSGRPAQRTPTYNCDRKEKGKDAPSAYSNFGTRNDSHQVPKQVGKGIAWMILRLT